MICEPTPITYLRPYEQPDNTYERFISNWLENISMCNTILSPFAVDTNQLSTRKDVSMYPRGLGLLSFSSGGPIPSATQIHTEKLAPSHTTRMRFTLKTNCVTKIITHLKMSELTRCRFLNSVNNSGSRRIKLPGMPRHSENLSMMNLVLLYRLLLVCEAPSKYFR